MATDYLDSDRIRRFYIHGFKEKLVHRRWPRLWNKHYRGRLLDRKFIKLPGQRRRLDFNILRKLTIKYAPCHLYMSVLNYLMLERVGEKRKANRSYPIGGEYVVDVDLHLFWRPHPHYVGLDGVFTRCLSISKDATLKIIDKISESHSDIHIVFSGKKGFHLHARAPRFLHWQRVKRCGRSNQNRLPLFGRCIGDPNIFLKQEGLGEDADEQVSSDTDLDNSDQAALYGYPVRSVSARGGDGDGYCSANHRCARASGNS